MWLSPPDNRKSVVSMESEEYSLALEFNISSQQLTNYRKNFDRFDLDGSGDIDMDEIFTAFSLLGKAPSSIAEALKLQQMVEEMDQDGSGALDFTEFVALMCYFELETHSVMDRQVEIAVNVTGFTQDEVCEFDRIFREYGPSGYLTVSDMRGILRLMGAKLSNDDVKTLGTMMKPLMVTEMYGIDAIEFPSFLVLMGEVVNSNFCNILNAAAGVVQKDAAERTRLMEPRAAISIIHTNRMSVLAEGERVPANWARASKSLCDDDDFESEEDEEDEVNFGPQDDVRKRLTPRTVDWYKKKSGDLDDMKRQYQTSQSRQRALAVLRTVIKRI